jgi:chemotaxis protein methyltransferase CheR
LTDFVLPELVKLKKDKEQKIRIWSAGCSTGEEPYSIAIALKKTIPDIEKWNISILATDINPKALRKARSGVFSSWSFRNSPAWLRSGYFHNKEDGHYEISQEIKKMVTFSCMSLVESSSLNTKSSIDIIFCRNVLMYFTPRWVTKIANSFFEELSDDGWFVVSSCELSSQVFPQFAFVNFHGAVLYRKTKNEAVPYMDPKPEEQQDLSYKTFFEHVNNTKWVPRKDFKPYHFIGQMPAQPVTPSPFHLVPAEAMMTGVDKFHNETSEESLDARISEIRLLADQGLLEKALSICNETIAINKLAHGLYFLRASILQELGKVSEAIASLKQSIYINPDYIMGHFMLGNLFLRLGNSRNSKKYFNNVLRLLNQCETDHNVPESEGLSLEYLKESIFSNMKTLITK